MRFFNKIELEKQMQHLKDLDSRIQKATELHRIPLSLEDIPTSDEGSLIQKMTNQEIIKHFGKLAHPMIKQVNLGYIEEEKLPFGIVMPLRNLGKINLEDSKKLRSVANGVFFVLVR